MAASASAATDLSGVPAANLRAVGSIPLEFAMAYRRPAMHETVVQSLRVVGTEVGLLPGARKPVLELDPGTLSTLVYATGRQCPRVLCYSTVLTSMLLFPSPN